MTNGRIPPANVPFIDDRGMVNPIWYRFLAGTEKKAATAASGEVIAGAGLEGGGAVAGGVNIAVADGGITNALFREALGTSVVGKLDGGVGDVADIQATGDKRVLTRDGGVLAFRANPRLEGVVLDKLEMTPTASASAATPSTHKVPIRVGSANYFVLLTT